MDESSESKSPKFTFKARLVVLGYEDPLAMKYLEAMTNLSQMIILRYAANSQWDIESFDIKAAFL